MERSAIRVCRPGFSLRTFRPRVAVLLNIAPDHLDWHGGFDAYIEAKARVFEYQRADDILD